MCEGGGGGGGGGGLKAGQLGCKILKVTNA